MGRGFPPLTLPPPTVIVGSSSYCYVAALRQHSDVPQMFKCTSNVPSDIPPSIIPSDAPHISRCSPDVPQIFKCTPDVSQM